MKILDILNETVVPIFETDYYVPITVEFHENDCSTEELFYFRLLNEKSSFLEFKINSESRKIYSITLVSLNEIKDIAGLDTIMDAIAIKTGNPLVSIEIWEDTRIFTVNENFDIVYDGNKLFILPEHISEISIRIAMPYVDLLVDQNERVIGCIFKEIPRDKKIELEECIKSIIPKETDKNLSKI